MTVDQAAVDFIRHHRATVAWVINAHVPAHWRDDVRQEVAYRIIRRFRNTGPVPNKGTSALAARIARSACIDQYRRQARHRTCTLESVGGIPDSAMGPQDLLETSQRRERLSNAIRALPQLKRHVIQQVLAGHSLVDVAHELERSHGSVKVLHHRAVNDLKKILLHR